MIWDLAPSSEYPTVREFAQQKKLALLAAHDSILAARVKQTRDANRKRQSAPFKEGDLVYLSSKNISFPKGLARKLIPKFIGPYKILRDFGNASFQLDLPQHLQRRGLHDVFHSSLLRVHVPNDDRLFPGRMDTQIGDITETDGEWAVDKILSHHGAKADALFEIKWKSGDVTWLPYYQITHLQALTDYFELLGTTRISNLPPGTGTPPAEDPQVFIGALTISHDIEPLLPSPIFHCFFSINTVIPFFNISFFPPTSFRSDFDPFFDMPFNSSIDHPRFARLTPTQYVVTDPNNYVSSVIHVGQIATFLQFDDDIRARGHLQGLGAIPLGFAEFAHTWNEGVRAQDTRRVSQVTMTSNAEEHFFEPSKHPLRIRDFHITPEQAGLVDEVRHNTTSNVQNDIMQEYATMMFRRQANQRRGYDERREKRLRAYSSGPQASESSKSDLFFTKATGKSRSKRAKVHAPRVESAPTPSGSGAPHAPDASAAPGIPAESSTTLPPAEHESQPMETAHD
jgi:hypothetical protein